MLNTLLVSDMIEKGDIGGIKEAIEKSLAEGSQTFESDLARLITEGTIDRKEGLANADSATNLMWRLQNDFARAGQQTEVAVQQAALDNTPSFTDFTLDVRS